MSLRCPNADCPFLRTHGFAPTYRAGATRCSDCGAALLELDDAGGATTAAIPSAALLARASGRGVAAPVVITALVVAATWALGLVPLPFLDVDRLHDWLDLGGDGQPDPLRPLSLAALGIAPWISAALLVEVGAALVPRWRALREPAGRPRLNAAVDRLGVVLAVVQALTLVRWLDGIGATGVPIIEEGGAGVSAVLVVSMVAGAVLVRLGVHLIDARGLGGGMSVLAAMPLAVALFGTFVSMVQATRLEVRPAGDLLLWLLVIAGGVGVALLVRPFSDDDRPPQPIAGLLPLLWGSAALQLLAATLPLFNVAPLSWGAQQTVLAAWAVVLTIGLGRVMHLRAAGFTQALPWSLAFVGALWALWVFAGWRGVAIDATAVVVLVCVARDLLGELSLMREAGPLATALTARSLGDAQALQGRLAAAGVAAHVRAAHHRALWHFFGPHLALDVLVPVADVERARAVVTDDASDQTPTASSA